MPCQEDENVSSTGFTHNHVQELFNRKYSKCVFIVRNYVD